MLRGSDAITGDTTLRGCLIWDRYLWLDFRTHPEGSLRVTDRPGHLVQHENLTATKHSGVFGVSHDGPTRFAATSMVPSGFGVLWNVLTVEIA